MVGVVGKALRGFGKALAKKGSGKAIKSVPIAKRLTDRRKDTESIFKIRQDAGGKPSTRIGETVKKVSKINTEYDKKIKDRAKKFKSQKRKVIGGASAGVVGAVGAMEVGKRKSPKFKKFIESSVTIKDGKLGLKPKK
tara:strand:- start:53 stop:466 length:414 start_codon:yes stop_codon:yes gene_type:complete